MKRAIVTVGIVPPFPALTASPILAARCSYAVIFCSARSSLPSALPISRRFSFHRAPVVSLNTVGAIWDSLSYRASWRTLAETIRSGLSAMIFSRLGASSVPTTWASLPYCAALAPR